MMSIGSLSLLRSKGGKRTNTALSDARYVACQPLDTSYAQVAERAEPDAADQTEPNATHLNRMPNGKAVIGKEVPDHELLERFQNGDEDGYVELYLRRQADVYTFALRLAQGDQDFASDLFQETFIKVYRKAHTFREGTNVIGWLYTIVRTTFLNHKRQRTFVGLDSSHDNIASSDRSMQPEFLGEQATLKSRVETAIARLAIEIREPFLLREYEGFSYQEISEQLAITLGAVRQRIYRAKRALREELWDLISDDPSLLPEDEG